MRLRLQLCLDQRAERSGKPGELPLLISREAHFGFGSVGNGSMPAHWCK